MMRRAFFLLLIVLFLGPCAKAAVIFVAQASAGGNTGANCANARALSSLVAGDWVAGNAIHLCGTITSSFSAQGNGSSGNVISIIFETGANITVAACPTLGCIGLNGRSWILVDGSPTATPCGYVNQVDVNCNGVIQATGNGTGGTNVDSVGVYARGGTSNIEVRNLAIINMYVHTCPNPATCNDTGGNNNVYGVWADGGPNNFHNLVCHDSYGCVKGEAGTNNTNVYNNHLYYANWDVAIFGTTATPATTNTIHDNDMHDWCNWDTTSDTHHHDGAFSAGDNNGTGTDHLQVYNNYLHGCLSNCAANCMTAPIYLNTMNHVSSYNNVIIPATGQFDLNGLIFYMSFGTLNANDLIANNTVICGTNAGSTGSGISIRGDASLTMQNNTVQGCNQFVHLDTGTTTFTSLTNNGYQDSALTNRWQIGSTNFSSLATWAAATTGGTEAGSIAQTTSLNLNANGRQLTGSAVIGAGTNLTSLGFTPLDSDALGNARPGGSTAWDIGAYFGTGLTVPTFFQSGISSIGGAAGF